MTLTELLAGLVVSGTENKELLIEVLAKLQSIEEKAVYFNFWVDPVGGDNTNSGLTAATALQTLNEAVARTPLGSYCNINLLADYTLAASLANSGRLVRINGVNSSGVATQRQLVQTVAGGTARRLIAEGGGFFLNRLDVMLTKTAITDGPAALVSGRLKTLFLLDCGINVETSVTTASVMGQDGISVLEVDTVTALDDAIAGYWVGGISSGTNPNTLGKVLTNLATL